MKQPVNYFGRRLRPQAAVDGQRVRLLVGGVAGFRCALILALAGLGTASRLAAQSAPVGVQTYAIAANSLTALGVPLIRPAAAVGIVASVDSNRLTLTLPTGAAPLNVSLPASGSYYIEVVAHADGPGSDLLGHRLEVDETSTRAAGGMTVVLEESSSLHTLGITRLAGLTRHRVVIRPHWTLAALFGAGAGTSLNAAVEAAQADQVHLWDGSGFEVFYFRAGPIAAWRSLSRGAAAQDDMIIAPGVGLFFKRQTGSTSFAAVGEVRTNAFVRTPLASGQLLAAGFPVASSPSELRLTAAAGLIAATELQNADQLLVWNGGSFDVYFLQTGPVPAWRALNNPAAAVNDSKLLPPGAALFLWAAQPATAPIAQPVPFNL
jgi:uncharacterized protein (TIGR02597 family)